MIADTKRPAEALADDSNAIFYLLVHKHFLPPVFHTAVLFDQCREFVVTIRFVVDRRHAERTTGRVVDAELRITVEVRDTDDVLLREYRRHFLRHIFGVLRTDLEAEDGTDVTEHGVAHLRVRLVIGCSLSDKLADVLGRHDETELVLPSLTEDCRKRVRHEVLEFVDVQIKPATLILRHIRARQRSHVHFIDEYETEKLCVHVADFSFAEVHEKDLSFVHDLTNVERALRLSDDVAHRRIRHERTELGREIRNHFFLLARAGLRDFMFPEAADDDVLAFANFVSLKLAIDEEPGHVDQGRSSLFVIHEGEAAVTEVVLDARAEDLVAEQLDEDLHRIERGTVFLFVCLRFQKVEAHRALHVGRIEDDHVLRAFLRNMREHILDQVPVRIDHAETGTGGDVLPGL